MKDTSTDVLRAGRLRGGKLVLPRRNHAVRQERPQTLMASYAEAPALWRIEIANVLAMNERKGRTTPVISSAFLQTLAELDIRVESGGLAIGADILLPLRGATA